MVHLGRVGTGPNEPMAFPSKLSSRLELPANISRYCPVTRAVSPRHFSPFRKTTIKSYIHQMCFNLSLSRPTQNERCECSNNTLRWYIETGINQSDIIIIPPRLRTSSRVDVGREEFQNLPSERRALVKSRKPHELPLCVGRGLVADLFADPSC